MLTIKQLADELLVDKQKVYRYIKKNDINEALQKNGMMYYDEAVKSELEKAFMIQTPHQRSASNDVLIDVLMKQSETLKKELLCKNEQIRELNERLAASQKLLDQEQQLRMITEQKVLLLEEKPKSIWHTLFRKSD